MAKFDNTRTFGIEIEFSFGPGNYHVPAQTIARQLSDNGIPCVAVGYTHDVMQTWKIVSDGSVTNGWELVSPPMSGLEAKETLRTALRVIKSLGAQTHSSCGIHIHHYVGDLKAKELANIAEIYKSHESVIDMFLSASRRNSSWAKSMRNGISHFEAASSSVFNDLELATSKRSLVNCLGPDRYHKVNFVAYLRYGTVEFRQHQSSLNINKLWSWIVFTQSIVNVAKGHRGKVVGRTVNTGPEATRAIRSLLREMGMRKAKDYDTVTLDAYKRMMKRLPRELRVHYRNGDSVDDAIDGGENEAIVTDSATIHAAN